MAPTSASPENPIITALDSWYRATDAYAECDPGIDPQPLETATDALIRHIDELASSARARGAWDVARAAREIFQTIREVSDRFTSGKYGDDDTDAPCDVEWDVHSLVASVDPSHQIPDEIEPSHVVGTWFSHPSDEE